MRDTRDSNRTFPIGGLLAQSGMENCQAFKEELQSDRNRFFRLVTGGTGA